MPKLVYINAVGHSGSTLLNMLLGTLPNTFSMGEVPFLPWNLYRERHMDVSVKNENICTCREKFSECPIWGKVVSKLKHYKEGRLLTESPLKYQMKFYDSTNAFGKKPTFFNLKTEALLMRSLINYGNGTIPKILHLLNKHIAENNWRLFDNLSEVTSAKVIIDSTIGFSRFYHLYNHRPDSAVFIMLVRSVYGVAASNMKRGRDPYKLASIWAKNNICTYRILTQMPEVPSLIVYYEDICKDPVTERKRIAEFLGHIVHQKEIAINSRNYHIVAGNPMRYNENIRIRYDDSWKQILDNKTIVRIQDIINHANVPEFLKYEI